MFIGLWLLFGLIGLAIGIKKGYHPGVAILAGLILGIYSPLMLFLSRKTKKCSECAEYVKIDARVCRYCGYKFILGEGKVEHSIPVRIGYGILFISLLIVLTVIAVSLITSLGL